MAKFNGHKNWNHWNVSLWINNDEGLYRTMQIHMKREANKDDAAKEMFYDLKDCEITHTPDGAPYSVSSIRSAMRD